MLTGRMIVSLQGQRVTEEEIAVIAHPMTAGIILFTKNVKSNDKDALKTLIGEIQAIAIQQGKPEGLPIFIDQEGGFVQRFGRGFTPLPTAAVFGETYDLNRETGVALAYHYGQKMALELQPFGTISLGPVVDLQAGNPVIEGLGRAFHRDPDKCAELATAYIEGMNAAGMLATGKHFPGHGQRVGDSHLMQPTDARLRDEIMSQDLVPFRQLIDAKKLAAIMPAHIVYPDVDPNNIAGMSSIWLNDILRGELGFEGLVISDCLAMVGAGIGLSHLERTLQSLPFVDVALLCHLPVMDLLSVLDGIGTEHLMTLEQQRKYSSWTAGSVEARMSLAREFQTSQRSILLEEAKIEPLALVGSTGVDNHFGSGVPMVAAFESKKVEARDALKTGTAGNESHSPRATSTTVAVVKL